MPRRTFKLTIRLSVPDRAGNLTLSPEAREFIRDALKVEATALTQPANLLRLHERYLSDARKKAAAARREMKVANTQVKKSQDAVATASATEARNIPVGEPPKSVSQNTVSNTAPASTEQAEPGKRTASIDIPPGNGTGTVQKESSATESKPPL